MISTLKMISILGGALVALSPRSQAAEIAGTRDGGGGVGVVCAFSTTELLDLHEARFRGESFQHDPKSEEAAIDLTATLISRHYWNPATIPPYLHKAKLIEFLIRPIFRGEAFTNVMTERKVPVEMGGPLPLSQDIGWAQIRSGCRLEQIAYFTDEPQTLKIDRARWQSLSWLDRSALVTHELLYWMERHEGLESYGSQKTAMTSERTRRFIGDLFRKQGIFPKYAGIPLSGAMSCSSDGRIADPTYLWAYGGERLKFLFTTLFGRSSPYQMRLELEGVSEKSLTDFFESAFDITEPLKLIGEHHAPRFFVHLTKAKKDYPQIETFAEIEGKLVSMGPPRSLFCRK